MGGFFKSLLRVGKTILPYAASYLFRRFRPRDKALANTMEIVLGLILEEVLSSHPGVREDLVPKLMADRLQAQYPGMEPEHTLKIASDYCKRNNNLRNRMAWR